MATRFLSGAEIQDLTGRVRYGSQRKALDTMGIRYHTRPDGRPVVQVSALAERTDAPVPAEAPGPNWGAISA